MFKRPAYQESVRGWSVHFTPEAQPISIYGIFCQGALEHPDKTAVTFFGRDLTYREVDGLAECFAAALSRLGVKEGDRVAALLPNCPQHLIALLAANRLGAIHVAVDMLSQGEELRGILSDSGARTVITLDLFFEKVMASVERTAVREVIVTGIDDLFPSAMSARYQANAHLDGIRAAIPYGSHVLRFADLLKGKARTAVNPAGFELDDTLMILCTTGSPNRGKRAVVTQRDLVYNVADLWQTLILRVSVWFSSRCFRQGGVCRPQSVGSAPAELRLRSPALMPVAC